MSSILWLLSICHHLFTKPTILDFFPLKNSLDTRVLESIRRWQYLMVSVFFHKTRNIDLSTNCPKYFNFHAFFLILFESSWIFIHKNIYGNYQRIFIFYYFISNNLIYLFFVDAKSSIFYPGKLGHSLLCHKNFGWRMETKNSLYCRLIGAWYLVQKHKGEIWEITIFISWKIQ